MNSPTWEEVRADFMLDPSPLHFAPMMVSTHSRAVRTEIARTRELLDRQPWFHVKSNLHAAEDAVCFAASAYFGSAPENIALTDSTTSGMSLLYSGLSIERGQEILTSRREFDGALHSMGVRHGADVTVRAIDLFKNPATVTEDEICTNLEAEIRAGTRVLGLTWVYSNSGVKLPIRRIAELVAKVNRNRSAKDRLLFCVDGVVGLGVEDETFDGLGCDFFVAGCHKFLFGPRGTAVWFGRPDAWPHCAKVAPTSSREFLGREFSPGGIHDYEHRWALKVAFDYLRQIGKARIANRVHELATRLKDELAGFGGRIRLITPRSRDLSSAIVCFDVPGKVGSSFVTALEGAGILATMSPADLDTDASTGEVKRTCGAGKNEECFIRHVRVAPSILTTDGDVARCLETIDRLSR